MEQYRPAYYFNEPVSTFTFIISYVLATICCWLPGMDLLRMLMHSDYSIVLFLMPRQCVVTQRGFDYWSSKLLGGTPVARYYHCEWVFRQWDQVVIFFCLFCQFILAELIGNILIYIEEVDLCQQTSWEIYYNEWLTEYFQPQSLYDVVWQVIHSKRNCIQKVPYFGGQSLDTDPDFGQYWHFLYPFLTYVLIKPIKTGTNTQFKHRRRHQDKLY